MTGNRIFCSHQIYHRLVLKLRCLLYQLHTFADKVLSEILIVDGFYFFEYLFRSLVHLPLQFYKLLPLQLVEFPLAIILSNSFGLLKIVLYLRVDAVQVDFYKFESRQLLMSSVFGVLV